MCKLEALNFFKTSLYEHLELSVVESKLLYEGVKSPKLWPVLKNLVYPKSIFPNYLLFFSPVLYCRDDKHKACLKLKSTKLFVRICRHFEKGTKLALKSW